MDVIKYKKFNNKKKTESYKLDSVEMVVNTVCAFDGTPLVMNIEYGNRQELYCCNCGSKYDASPSTSQEEIDSQREEILNNLEKKIGIREKEISESRKEINNMKKTKRILTRLSTEPISKE